MRTLIKKIHDIAYHRNGVFGTGFYVVLFTDIEKDRKIGVVFPEDSNPHNAVVLSVNKLAEGDIAFGSNSWRGDDYAKELRLFIAEKIKEG